MNLRETILNCEDLPLKEVEVEEWGTTLYVRNMTGTERDAYEASLIDNKDNTTKERLRNMRAQMVVMCTTDADGVRVFEDNDVEAVGMKAANALDKLVTAIRDLNGLDDSHIEEEAGN